MSLMMMKTNPITPPPELIERIIDESDTCIEMIQRAYAAGADQELEACCEWLECNYNYPQVNHPLRAARRPKPPSLKEQAKAELDRLIALIPAEGALAMAEPIRRALEALDD
jgi:hypothetical protein